MLAYCDRLFFNFLEGVVQAMPCKVRLSDISYAEKF